MMIKRVKLLLSRINSYISVKYTLIYFSLMAVLYFLQRRTQMPTTTTAWLWVVMIT